MQSDPTDYRRRQEEKLGQIIPVTDAAINWDWKEGFIDKKKYNLINGFEANLKAGRKDEEYAKRVGMVEFVVGIAILTAAIAIIIFA